VLIVRLLVKVLTTDDAKYSFPYMDSLAITLEFIIDRQYFYYIDRRIGINSNRVMVKEFALFCMKT